MSATLTQSVPEQPAQEQETEMDLARLQKARRRKLMFSAVLAGISVALLIAYAIKAGWFDWGTPKSSAAAKEKEAVLQFDASGNIRGQPATTETEASLLELAERAKKAGLVIMGVSQCGWTKRQREMFGGSGSKARKVIESIYIECRNRELCPNVRGYPTWVRGDNQYPGFKDAARLRALVDELSTLPEKPMLQQPAEPVEDETAFPTIDSRAIKAASDVATASQAIAEGIETRQAQEKKKTEETRKENVRGVSSYPPLNVPDMPGTAPWALHEGHAENQFRQGNLPRQAVDNPDPVIELARQMASTFQQIAHDAARDPGASDFSTARLPQSANITSGDPIQEKRIYTEKN